MICRHCGTKIDTRYREADGSVVCPGCGMRYRPKSASKTIDTVSTAHQATEASAPNQQRTTTDVTSRTKSANGNYSRPQARSSMLTQSPSRRAKKRTNTMLKRATIILASLAVVVGGILIITANRGSSYTDTASTYNSTSNMQSDTSYGTSSAIANPSSVSYATEATPALSQEPIKPVIEKQYAIQKILSDFNGDRAWVSYLDSNNKRNYALIDTNGYVVYSIPASELKGWGGYIGAQTFPDGVCCLWSSFYDGFSINRSQAGMLIVDSMGNTIFNGIDGEADHRYFYMGYGDGTILALENVSGFSENSFSLCEIDHTGGIIHQTPVSDAMVKDGIYDDYSYYGQNMFYGGWGYATLGGKLHAVYDREDHCLISLSAYQLFQPFEAGVTVCGSVSERSIGDSIYRYKKVYQITINDLKNAEVLGENSINADELTLIGDYYIYPFQSSERLIVTDFRNDGWGYGEEIIGVYDYSGNLLSAFPDNWNLKGSSGFSGGYAVIILKGADGNTYITAIDADYNPQYEPIKIDDYELIARWNREWIPAFWNGYVSVTIAGRNTILSPQGKEVTKTDLDALASDYTVGDIVVRNGFEAKYDNKKDVYNSFERSDGTVLDTIYFLKPGTYSASASPPQPATAQATQTAAPQKNYTSPSSFSIEGKWKNIGTYTFGQVQAGAIVIFDGTNCNVYSPADTYAFYRDGDHYTLDCTSVLFSETLSFTVKIVDDNHVDFYRGNNCLELQRVS